jgi:hypothetical protein
MISSNLTFRASCSQRNWLKGISIDLRYTVHISHNRAGHRIAPFPKGFAQLPIFMDNARP